MHARCTASTKINYIVACESFKMASRSRRVTPRLMKEPSKEQLITSSRKQKCTEDTVTLTTKQDRKQQKTANKDAKLPPTKHKSKQTGKQPTPAHTNAKSTDEVECCDDQSTLPASPPLMKRWTRKVLNKKERKELCDHLNSVNPTIID